MATQSNIDIKILAEFLGKSAFKQADTAVNKLNRNVKSLGQSFGVAFGGAALGYAIKSTIRDFADAERETQQLTNTVKNLGLAFAAPQVDAYVQSIGKLYGVTGDQAVPAMQALLTATGSVSRSTKIMNVALDLAASRNADVASVAKDLASAYVGNTKGLNQYRLGLTKAELSAMTFDEILEKIASQTLGSADEAAKTLSGQLAILSEVSNQAKERIGGGLFQALGGLAGPDGAGGAAKNIENLSIKLTNAITGFGYLVQEVKIAQPILVAAGVAIGLAWAPWFTAIATAALAIGAIGNAMKKNTPQVPMNTGKLFFPTAGDGGYKERLAAEKKAELDAAKTKLDAAQKRLAEVEPLLDKANKYDELATKYDTMKIQTAFSTVKPAFSSEANAFEVKARWQEFVDGIQAKYNVELVDGVAMCVDKENQYSTFKLEDLVAADENIKSLTTGRQQQGSNAKVAKGTKIEGVPFEINKESTNPEKYAAIREYLTTKEGLDRNSKAYSEKFAEYRKKIFA